MRITNYQRKTTKIQAIQYTKNNKDTILTWIANSNSKAYYKNNQLTIITPEGSQPALPNDYIIKQSNEFYVCKPSEFNQLYQQIE